MMREPAVAGQFYSGDSRKLLQEIRSFVSTPAEILNARAVIAPHAGYMYSGGVAGAVYGSVRLPHRSIVVGPNHRGIGLPLALYPAGAWRTPLGLASIDSELNEHLLREYPLLREDWASHLTEHSLEVQIPFLQVLMPGFRFAAICVGSLDYGTLEQLGHGLSRVLASLPDPVLLISSSDMNHYESASVSARKDQLAIEQILALNPAGLFRVVREKNISMCGIAPTVAVLTACQDLGCSKAILVRYAHSGEVSGDNERVVGYAGIVIL